MATTLPNLTATSAWALACLGEADAATERADEAERLLQAARAASRLAGNSWSYVWLCRAYVRLGRVADAARGIVRVLEPRTTAAEAYAWYLRGEIGAVRPDRETPEACYARAIDLANTVGLRPLAAHCHLGLGTVHGRAGRRDNARAELAIAIGMYREMGIAFWQSEAERELGITSSPR